MNFLERESLINKLEWLEIDDICELSLDSFDEEQEFYSYDFDSIATIVELKEIAENEGYEVEW